MMSEGTMFSGSEIMKSQTCQSNTATDSNAVRDDEFVLCRLWLHGILPHWRCCLLQRVCSICSQEQSIMLMLKKLLMKAIIIDIWVVIRGHHRPVSVSGHTTRRNVADLPAGMSPSDEEYSGPSVPLI